MDAASSKLPVRNRVDNQTWSKCNIPPRIDAILRCGKSTLIDFQSAVWSHFQPITWMNPIEFSSLTDGHNHTVTFPDSFTIRDQLGIEATLFIKSASYRERFHCESMTCFS